MTKVLSVNGTPYQIQMLLGHGKGGYSYLAMQKGTTQPVVLKQIHHEPCDYYTFGDKIAAEERDYRRLMQAGIRIPKLLDLDRETERIVKEYIDGETIAALVAKNKLPDLALSQIETMAALAQNAGLNIDYYPTNFILQNGLLWYIDYECNAYDPQWDFAHWGRAYWQPKT